jgi:hypothetical protein
MKPSATMTIVIGFSLFSLYSKPGFTAQDQATSGNLVPVQPGIPLHEQTLALINNSESVLPPSLDVHPITAMYNREAIIPP